MKTKAFSLVIKNDIENLVRIRQYIDELGLKLELPVGIIMNLNLVIEEIVTNIINYAYSDDRDHEIVVCTLMEDQCLLISIEDDGREFNMLTHPDPDTDLPVDKRNIGGLGIHFVRKLMDEIEYKRNDNKNILLLKKYLE